MRGPRGINLNWSGDNAVMSLLFVIINNLCHVGLCDILIKIAVLLCSMNDFVRGFLVDLREG